MLFKDKNQRLFDFGQGQNNYNVSLYSEDMGQANPTLINKKMIIHWQWRQTTSTCCGYDSSVRAYRPSITNIQPLK
jgi:hypothetical protein